MFERGLAAARHYRDREGTLDGILRKQVETIVDDIGIEHEVKLGLWLINTKTRLSLLIAGRVAALNVPSIRWP